MNQEELKVVLTAGIAMAQKDGKFEKHEAELIQRFLDLAGLTLMEVGGLDGLEEESPEQTVLSLGSVKAKRTYLLTLACVALADKDLDPSELSYFKEKAQKLGVGTIDLENLTLEKAVATLERIIGDVEPNTGTMGQQPSDIDFM